MTNTINVQDTVTMNKGFLLELKSILEGGRFDLPLNRINPVYNEIIKALQTQPESEVIETKKDKKD